MKLEADGEREFLIDMKYWSVCTIFKSDFIFWSDRALKRMKEMKEMKAEGSRPWVVIPELETRFTYQLNSTQCNLQFIMLLLVQEITSSRMKLSTLACNDNFPVTRKCNHAIFSLTFLHCLKQHPLHMLAKQKQRRLYNGNKLIERASAADAAE